MPFDFKSLHKLESVPSSVSARSRNANDVVQVIIKLRKGARRPPYIKLRSQVTGRMITADVRFADMQRLEADPGVESMSLNRRLPGMK